MQLSDFTSHPLFALSGWVIGAAGLLYGIFALKRKKLLYVQRTSPIIGQEINNVTKVKIFYGDREIKRLSATAVTIWNDGRHYLEAQDIASAAPLEISIANECQILECRLELSSSKGNNTRIVEVEANKRYRIEFDFLNSKQGCRITVLHDAVTGKAITITGEIKEGGKIEKPKVLLQRNGVPEFIPAMLVSTVFGMAAGYAAVFATWTLWLRIPLGLFCLFVLWMLSKAAQAKVIPKELTGEESAPKSGTHA